MACESDAVRAQAAGKGDGKESKSLALVPSSRSSIIGPGGQQNFVVLKLATISRESPDFAKTPVRSMTVLAPSLIVVCDLRSRRACCSFALSLLLVQIATDLEVDVGALVLALDPESVQKIGTFFLKEFMPVFGFSLCRSSWLFLIYCD